VGYRGTIICRGDRVVWFHIRKHPRPRAQKKWTAWTQRSWGADAGQRPVPYERTPEDVLRGLLLRFRARKRGGLSWKRGSPRLAVQA
jgi:hypothetical protein